MSERVHRSERRFHAHLRRAISDHQKKLDEGSFSLSPEEGKLAVLASWGTTTNSEYSAKEQIRIFRTEAERVAASPLAAAYAAAEVVQVAGKMDVDFVLADPEVAGMVLVGHGNIAELRLHHDKHMIWWETARATRQLKLGHFVQRMCGHFETSDSLPMGTFAVADQRNIVAALGVPIDDKYPDESLFRTVYDESMNDAESILAVRNQYWNGGPTHH